MGRWLQQVLAITSLNLRTLPQRAGASAATLFGVAGVVAVFVGVLSIAEGFRAAMSSTGAEDIAIVMRSGTDSEMMSGIGRDDADIIKQAPGVLRDANGPVASAELFVIVDLPKRSTGTEANVPLRGVQANAMAARNGVQLVSGRMFEPGRNEVIAGVSAVREFVGLEVGKTQRWGENEWTVVGTFTANGTVTESELWTDVAVLQPAYQRGTSFQSVRAKLASPASFQQFKDALTADPQLEVQVVRESEYLANQ